MSPFSTHPSAPAPHPPAASQRLTVDRWHRAAESDYWLCRLFADRYEARLCLSLRSRRVGWEREGRRVYGILLPDALSSAGPADDAWYIYYVWGETLFRRTRKERETLRMLVMPDGVEDWAELLRQAVRREVFDVRYQVAPQYVNALGEVETEPSGYEFTLSAYAPPPAVTTPFEVAGMGETPEAAARDACCRWLKRADSDVIA